MLLQRPPFFVAKHREVNHYFSSISPQQRFHQCDSRHGGFAGEMGDLASARKSGSDDHVVRTHFSDSREKPQLADHPRDLIVFPFIAEGAGHSAASAVKYLDIAVRQ